MSKSYDPKHRKIKKSIQPTKQSVKSVKQKPFLESPVSLEAFSFKNLNKAYKKARKGKRNQNECIEFTLNLNQNLLELEKSIKNRTYTMGGYYSFYVTDPKKRLINALHFSDRVVQHVLCDEILGPLLEPRLIYDNAACRKSKGTHFALKRLTQFFVSYIKEYSLNGYILRFDIKKFFDNIEHDILKEKLRKVIKNEGVLWLLDLIIDSYESTTGKGLPLGNQTSQWFAIFYLDDMDRLITEKLEIKAFSRYMDDGVMLCCSKLVLQDVQKAMEDFAREKLKISFNSKTQIFPFKNGVDYLGFHFKITNTGKVIRKVRRATKKKFRRRLRKMDKLLEEGKITAEEIQTIKTSYRAHFKHGTAKGLIKLTHY